MPGATWISPPAGHVLTLGRVAEVHRQRAREHDERLLLELVPVAAPLRARLVAPDVRAGVGEAGRLAQLGDVAGRLTGLVGARDPLELVGIDRPEGHSWRLRPGRCRTSKHDARLQTWV